MSSENELTNLKSQINFNNSYSQKDWQKDIKEFGKLSVTLSTERATDLAEFMMILINSHSPEKRKKELFKAKYKTLVVLTMSEFGEKGYVSFVKEKMKRFKKK